MEIDRRDRLQPTCNAWKGVYHAWVPCRTKTSIYGGVKLLTAYCGRCQRRSFLEENGGDEVITACCGEEASPDPEGVEVIAPGRDRRRRPSAKRRLDLIEKQGDACYWCDRKIGTPILKHRELVWLRRVWDHFSPFAFSRDNQDGNFVLACHVCNGFKSSLMFETEEEVRSHVRRSWARSGITEATEKDVRNDELRLLRKDHDPLEAVATILPTEVPPSLPRQETQELRVECEKIPPVEPPVENGSRGCRYCGGAFIAKRAWHRFCRPLCRLRFFQKKPGSVS